MTKMPALTDILNDTPADATQVETNYNTIEQFVNNDLINKDGSVHMEQHLLLDAGDPIQPKQAATKSYVDAVLPVGIIMPWPAENAPAGGKWHLCDGLPLSKATYSALYDLIGTSYNHTLVTDPDMFRLPDLKGRIIFGYNPSKVAFEDMGKIGGTYITPVPAHDHAMAHVHPIAHTHEYPHTHNVDPAPLDTTDAGGHNHDTTTSVRQSATSGATSSFMRADSDGAAATIAGGATGNPTVSTDGVHHHAINIPSTTSTQPNEATTGAVSVPNSGAVITTSIPANPIVPGHTDTTGTANVEHLLPYLTLNYIIRVL